MPVIEVPANLSVEHLLDAARLLSQTELDRFAQGLRELEAQRISSADDEDLLARVAANSQLPPTDRQRLDELARKGEDDTLTPDEEKEYQALWVHAEEMSATRLEALLEIARRRGVSVRQLMHDLSLDQLSDGS